VKLGILLSGRGSNFEAIARNIRSGALDCEIGFVFSNRTAAPGLALARELGYPCASLESKGVDRTEFDAQVVDLLTAHSVELVCLAGYMRLLSGHFISQFPGRILNVHPSLLPAFPGLDAQRQALAHGVGVSGATVHLVTSELDGGPIIMQSAVPVLGDDTVDTLSARILVEEHRIYPEAIQLVLDGGWSIDGRRFVHRARS